MYTRKISHGDFSEQPIGFYDSLGGEFLKNRRVLRLTGDALASAARQQR
jgi:hypothetical protein